VILEGKRIDGVPPHEVASLGIGQAPEGRWIFPRLTVLENLEMGAFSRNDHNGIQEDLTYVFELFPRLKERRKQQGGTLSGGEQQMLAIGRALMARPRLLLLDEPSMGLAPMLVDLIFETVENINKEGMTILLVEQNALMALQVAHRGYVLQTGQIVLQGDAKRLQANEMVRKAYLGED
jgi:branched-chain amino acid transport system ATP-binding protein